MAQGFFPRVRVAATDGFDRGRELGSKTANQIRGSIEVYRQAFAHYTGLEWDAVRGRAADFMEPISAFDREIASEIEGLAAGAAVEVEDILAINARSEIMFGLSVLPPPECTSFFVDAAGTRSRHPLLGQNWDWRMQTATTTLLVEIEQGERPSLMMLAEAGLVGKVGFNSAGIAVATNTLVSDLDRGRPAVPMHIVLRAILNSSAFEQAQEAVLRAERAGSANYLIASSGGTAVDIEAGPGNRRNASLIAPVGGVLVHANNFRATNGFEDATASIWLDSPIRAETLETGLRREYGELDLVAIARLLADHTCFPNAVCRHPDPTQPPAERTSTVASWIVDLAAATAAVCFGPPCEGTYVRVSPAFAESQP